ncbi:hypothetical protein FHW88_003089 [Mucilaginibacter sp. SG538B]|jgi:hypothetical protein|uniref:hypothetical protein n=1 Tax=Mucilaginibacter TaxID=423349 RepID=UPI00087186E7|nr:MULTISPECIES: hypothetical protein [unclassified Mucilaginibacter]NVM64800.1 hypothetical protein [Mucilaginibacter sp. SG538B]SCW82719.1 hypothetical protein SAMN03159284_04645 [Mucilaginibacter sp. NFR10]
MLVSLIEITLFLTVIILAVSGPRKRKKKDNNINPDALLRSEYHITENGGLEHVKSEI